jgi:hypothetical protein
MAIQWLASNSYRHGDVKLVRTFTKPDQKRRLHIYQANTGLFWFSEEFEDREDLTDFGMGVSVFWSPSVPSGLYGTIEDAERDARAVIPWLRETSA